MENKNEFTPELGLDEQKNQEGQEQDENQEQDQKPDESKSNEDDKDWKAEALKYKAILDRNKNKQKDDKEPSKKSDGLDYAEKAFLKSSGINQNEFDFVRDELKQSGFKDYDSLLENDYFKSKLENRRELEKTQNATIKGRTPNGVATNSVEYWLSKPIEEVPADMRIKVVNAKLEKEKVKGVFYNS